MKLKAKTKDCRLVIKAQASFGETIAEKELDRFARIYLRGFLKPRRIKKNHMEYTGPVGVSLYERLKKPITKRDFFFVLEQIVAAAQKLQANGMPLDPLVTNIRYAYINEVTKELQLLYIPVTPPGDGNIMEFIEEIVYSAKPADERESDFVSRFIYFIRSLKPFDLRAIEQYISREDRSIVNMIKRQMIGQSGFMTDKKQHYYEHYDPQPKDLDDEATGLLAEEEQATGLLYDGEATGLLDEGATGLLEEEGEDTALLQENQTDVQYPTLFRVLTEETIAINKPVFRLGKEKSYVDYFVTSNVAVSRSHADIITRGSRYFVVDLNSKNHTYINDRQIPSHCETEIFDGDKLKLGNEEFYFHVKTAARSFR